MGKPKSSSANKGNLQAAKQTSAPPVVRQTSVTSVVKESVAPEKVFFFFLFFLFFLHPCNLLLFFAFQLFHAVKENHGEEVTSLLRGLRDINVDINVTDEKGGSVLHVACRHGRAKILPLLMAHPGINVNLKTSAGMTPLAVACHNGHVEAVRILLKDARVSVNEKSRDGRTPLGWALSFGHWKTAMWLLREGKDVSLEKAVDHARGDKNMIALLNDFVNDQNSAMKTLQAKLDAQGTFPSPLSFK